MKKFSLMKNVFLISFGLFALLLSCSSDETQVSTIDLIEFESSELITRSSAKKFDSEIYYYKTIASFGLGSKSYSNQAIDKITNDQIYYLLKLDISSIDSVSNISWNQNFENLKGEYSLSEVESFQVDQNTKIISLISNSKTTDPIDLAKKLSKIQFVFRVMIKERP